MNKKIEHPVSPRVFELAETFKVPFGDRLATRSHVYDGQNIALWWYHRKLRRVMPLSDHDLLHEIGHYVTANTMQRCIPEYGLGMADPSYGERYYRADLAISHQEGTIQECFAQLFSIYFGRRLNVPAYLSDSPKYAKSWDDYELKKFSPLERFRGWANASDWETYRQSVERFERFRFTHGF